jgi:hypothetical protein
LISTEIENRAKEIPNKKAAKKETKGASYLSNKTPALVTKKH